MSETAQRQDGITEAEAGLRRFFDAHQVEYSAGRGIGCRCEEPELAAGSSTLASFWVDQIDIDAHRAKLLANHLATGGALADLLVAVPADDE